MWRTAAEIETKTPDALRRLDLARCTCLPSAIAYWLWSAVTALYLGLVTANTCDERAFGCGRHGYDADSARAGPSWFEPWTLNEFYVFPEVIEVGLIGLVAASAFVVFVMLEWRLPGVLALVTSLVLLSYPYFASVGLGLVPGLLGVFLGTSALVKMGWSSRIAAP